MDRAALVLMLLLLGGCATQPQETPEQAAERRLVSCREAGFTPDTEAWRLCLLIERQNDRLSEMERRLRIIDSQTLAPPFYGPGRWYW